MVRLFYGPCAYSKAINAARSFGTLLEGISDKPGLDKESAMKVAEYCMTLRQNKVSILIGPMEDIRPTSTDALLKTLEEHDSNFGFFLFGSDLSEISPTIISRSHAEYCPTDKDQRVREMDMKSPLEDVVESPVRLAAWLKSNTDEKVLRSSLELLAGSSVWEKARPILVHERITASHILEAFL